MTRFKKKLSIGCAGLLLVVLVFVISARRFIFHELRHRSHHSERRGEKDVEAHFSAKGRASCASRARARSAELQIRQKSPFQSTRVRSRGVLRVQPGLAMVAVGAGSARAPRHASMCATVDSSVMTARTLSLPPQRAQRFTSTSKVLAKSRAHSGRETRA